MASKPQWSFYKTNVSHPIRWLLWLSLSIQYKVFSSGVSMWRQVVLCWWYNPGTGLVRCSTELDPSSQRLYCGINAQIKCIHLATSWTFLRRRFPAGIKSSLFSYYAKQYLTLKGSSPLCPAELLLCCSLFNSPWRKVFLDYLCPWVLTLAVISFTLQDSLPFGIIPCIFKLCLDLPES